MIDTSNDLEHDRNTYRHMIFAVLLFITAFKDHKFRAYIKWLNAIQDVCLWESTLPFLQSSSLCYFTTRLWFVKSTQQIPQSSPIANSQGYRKKSVSHNLRYFARKICRRFSFRRHDLFSTTTVDSALLTADLRLSAGCGGCSEWK